MQRLLSLSTIAVTVAVFLFSAVPSQGENRNAEVVAEAEGKREKHEEDPQQNKDGEQEKRGDEGAVAPEKKKAKLVLKGGSRMIRTNPLPPSEEPEEPSGEKRKREMEHRMRVLLSRLPGFASQHLPAPVHREILVADAPVRPSAPASGLPLDAPARAVSFTPGPAVLAPAAHDFVAPAPADQVTITPRAAALRETSPGYSVQIDGMMSRVPAPADALQHPERLYTDRRFLPGVVPLEQQQILPTANLQLPAAAQVGVGAEQRAATGLQQLARLAAYYSQHLEPPTDAPEKEKAEPLTEPETEGFQGLLQALRDAGNWFMGLIPDFGFSEEDDPSDTEHIPQRYFKDGPPRQQGWNREE